MNAPLHTGFANGSRVRPVRQTEVAECGLACLAMVAGSHGLDVDIASLRRRFQPSMRGASLKTLIAMADAMGFNSRAVKLPLEELRSLHAPAVLHWDMNHYVVLEQVRGRKALIHNPDGRSRWYGLDELSNHFTGVAVELRPADDFQPGKERERLKLSQLWRRMTGLKRSLAQTLVLSLAMQAFVLASPYYMQVAIDSALPALDGNLLTVLALGFGLFTLINAGAMLLRSFVLLLAGSSLSYGIASNIARRLFRLPVSWFEKRHVGDILSRFQSIAPIQQALTQGAVAALIDGALAALILAVMLFYSLKLALVAVVAFGLYAAVRAISFSLEREAQQEAIIASAKEQSTMVESVRGIITLRLFNRETARHALWQTRLADSVNASIRLSRISIWQSVANSLIFGLENIISIWLAIGFVIAGGFSVGMVFAFIAYKTQFTTRAASLIDQAIVFRMLGLHLERLSDIALADQDVGFVQQPPIMQRVEGRLELREVRFRYSATDQYVLDGINLVIEPGAHVAITGPSGGGKSTLVKIILGLLEPESGEVLIDGIPLNQFGYENFREQVGAVLQEDHLFAGSIADNIALFEDNPDMDLVASAAASAVIHDDIARMPLGYDTLVGDMGSSLSGGQKQRVLLARALYRKPRLLLMDEGTSNLDGQCELAINSAIATIDSGRVIVAHRIETLLSAAEVYSLSGGKISNVTEQFTSIKQSLLQQGHRNIPQ
jgi:ATP-binding cassette, subfamily B, bacterial CvaB/MchF/RaxB